MAEMAKVLLIEDEESYRLALEMNLAREGFDIVSAETGTRGLELFHSTQPDLILLDLMLPEMSGLDVCREIRAVSDVPIIMVTAKSAEVDTVVGLEVGADDYVTKPYRRHELVARMRAALRRHGKLRLAEDLTVDPVLRVGGLELDTDSYEVSVDGQVVSLPLKEFELLQLLMEHPGRVMERHRLISRVWGVDYVGDTKTLDVHIKRLRSRIEPDPASPSRVLTVRGVGYKLAKPKSS